MAVKKRGNRWRVTVYAGIDPRTGKRKQLAGSAATRDEARDLERRLKAKAWSRRPGTADSLKAVFDEWWSGDRGVSGRTAAKYRAALVNHVFDFRPTPRGPTLGEMPLDRIGPVVVRRLQTHLLDKGLGPSTVRTNMRTALSALFTFAVAMEYTAENPVHKVRPPAVHDDPDERPAPELEHCAALILWLEENDSDFLDFMYVEMDLGCRPGEALALRWRHIREDGTVAIQRAMTLDEDYRLVDAPVNKTRERREPALATYTLQRLAVRRRRVEERLSGASGTPTTVDPEHYVFFQPRSMGTKATWPTSMSRRFRLAKVGAGLDPRVTLYGVKRTMITEWGEAGVPPKVIQERVGHSSDAMMLHYQRARKKTDRAAAELMAETVQKAVEAERRKKASAVQLGFFDD